VKRVRHIFRWDLDKTYLKTEFETVRGLVRTARAPAEARENIPGSAALIRAIRSSAPEGFAHQVFFISGSPNQMRTKLEKKFEIDGFAPDGFSLKPTVGNFFRGRFRAIRGQVAYKLAELIQGRADSPIGTPETLFGDDAESDAFIYTLYAELLAGGVDVEHLRAILKKAGAYGDQMATIEQRLEAVVHERAVKRIIIHLDQRTPPAAFAPYFPLLVPIYNHLQTAIVLYLDDTIGPEAIRSVAGELLQKYGFDEHRLANLSEDILRRVRMRYPIEHLERLAQHLDELRASNGAPGNLTTLLEKVSERARYLIGRPLVSEENVPARQRYDWDALLDSERTRKEEQKRLRKLAAPRLEETVE
jgi:hypothetical protein